MSEQKTTTTTTPTALNSIKIQDEESLNKIKAEMIEPFISKSEEGTMDEEILDTERYMKSAEQIGGQYIPVAIAYCPNDPTMTKKLEDGKANPNYNPDSEFRVHGRIIDGRHRWLNAKSSGKNWDLQWYTVKDFPHYEILRKTLDQKKAPNRKENEVFFAQACKYEFEQNGTSLENVCKVIVEKFQTTMSPPAIRSFIPSMFKDSKMAALRQGATKEIEDTVAGKKIAEKLKKKTVKELSKKDKEIEKLHLEQSENYNKIIELEGEIKSSGETIKEYFDLQPFISGVHRAKVQGADLEVEVRLDLTKKEVIVKKI